MKYKLLLFIILSVFISNICLAKRYISYGGYENSCKNSMRVIMSAVDMYNMDNSKKITKITLGKTDDIIEKLKRGNYIKGGISRCYSTARYSYYSIGDLSSNNGTLACEIHGALDGRETKDKGYRMANSSSNNSSSEIEENFMLSLGLSFCLTLISFIIIKFEEYSKKSKSS